MRWHFSDGFFFFFLKKKEKRGGVGFRLIGFFYLGVRNIFSFVCAYS